MNYYGALDQTGLVIPVKSAVNHQDSRSLFYMDYMIISNANMKRSFYGCTH